MRLQTVRAVLAMFMVLSAVVVLIQAWEAQAQDTDTYPFQVDNGTETSITAACGDGSNSVTLDAGEESSVIDCAADSIEITHLASSSNEEYQYGEGLDLDADCKSGHGTRRVYHLYVMDLPVYYTELLQTQNSIAFQISCQ